MDDGTMSHEEIMTRELRHRDARMRANASIATSTTPPAIAYTGHGA